MTAPTRRRRFKEPDHQQVYDALRKDAPDPDRVRGMSGSGNAYAAGFTQPDQPSRLWRMGSRAYAAWAAGVDNARDRARATPKPTPTPLSPSQQLANLRDALADWEVERILSLSDEELRAEIIADGEDPDELAAEGKRAFDCAFAEHERRKPTPTCPCGSTNVQIGGKTADGKTACRCRVCGFPWAEVLS